MNKKRNSHKLAQVAFTGIGLCGVFIGVGIILYSIFGLRPKLNSLINELQSGINQSQLVIGEAETKGNLWTSSTGTLKAGSQLVTLLPQTFYQIDQVLRQGSEVSGATGNTAEETKKSLPGVVLPKKELAKSASALKATANRMKKLSTRLAELGTASEDFSREFEKFSQGSEGLSKKHFGAKGPFLDVSKWLERVSEAMANVAIPIQAMFMGIALGGIFILGGSLGLATAFHLSIEAAAKA